MNCYANVRTASFGLVLGLLLTATALSQDQTPVGANTLRGPVRHTRVCAGPAPEGEARCHAHLVMNNSGQVMAAVTSVRLLANRFAQCL